MGILAVERVSLGKEGDEERCRPARERERERERDREREGGRDKGRRESRNSYRVLLGILSVL